MFTVKTDGNTIGSEYRPTVLSRRGLDQRGFDRRCCWRGYDQRGLDRRGFEPCTVFCARFCALGFDGRGFLRRQYIVSQGGSLKKKGELNTASLGSRSRSIGRRQLNRTDTLVTLYCHF